jgi:hypothetical protein
MADGEERKADDRAEFIRARVANAFKHLKADRIDKGFYATESMCVPAWVVVALRALLPLAMSMVSGACDSAVRL